MEYLTCNAILQFDGDYQAEVQGRVIKASLDHIFNTLAVDGWDMVNCFPSSWNTAPADAPAFDIVGVMAVFKRPVQKAKQPLSGGVYVPDPDDDFDDE